jgi:hypothetical protein
VSYIKISDPSIIDLAAWQQVINVVNQHSDSLSAITNNFGASSDYSVSDTSHIYDPGSQSIIYGRATANTNLPSSGSDYYGQVTFANTTSGINSFSQQPIVTATLYGYNISNNEDVIVSVYNVTPTGFNFRLYRARGGLATLNTTTKNSVTSTVSPTAVDQTKTFYINWVAVGPK